MKILPGGRFKAFCNSALASPMLIVVSLILTALPSLETALPAPVSLRCYEFKGTETYCVFSCVQIIRCLVLVLYDKVKYLLDLDIEHVTSHDR